MSVFFSNEGRWYIVKKGRVLIVVVALFSLFMFFVAPDGVYAANFESSMYGYHVKGVQDGKRLDQRYIFADEDISPASYRVEGKSSVSPFNGTTYVWRGMAYRNFYNSETDNFAMYSYAYLFEDGPVLDSSENYEYSFNLVQDTNTSSSVVMSNFGNIKVFYRYSIDTVDYSYICTVGDVSNRWGATRKISCVIPGSANTSQYEIFFDFEDSLYESSAQIPFVVSVKPSYSVTDLLPNLEPTPTPTPTNPNQGVEDKLDEVNETNKNIFEAILDLPNTIVNLLIDGLSSLFIPSDDFLQNWFTEMQESLEEQLGFLSYPTTWIITILQRFMTLEDTGSYVLSWGNINVPLFDVPIIQAGSFDLATLLENDTINTFHEIYFMVLNALTLLAFMGLCMNTYNRIFGGDQDNYTYLSVENSYDVDPSTGEILTQHTRERESRRVKNR